MDRFPTEFSALLTSRGRSILADRRGVLARALDADRLVYIEGAIARDTAMAAHDLLERQLRPCLVPLVRAIPPEAIANQTRNHQERLIKVARQETAYLERRSSRAWKAADRIGLIAMLQSESLRNLAQRLSGRPLDRRSGQQVLRYGPGDYVGPHTDHYPEDPRAAGGYLDVHVSFGHPDVRHHYLVWALDGHFTRMVDVNRPGGIAIYRLPFWHYTTPLVARVGREATASRWVALATYRFAPAAGRPRAHAFGGKVGPSS
ncbi:MAG: hypothetical protein JNL66_19530 [Alphaproteobacteria bacterium]|nr:hypothetical protein [Alphaproteobacteria bacterium]